MDLSRNGAWALTATAGLGFLVALFAWLHRGSGVDHTPGALLVVVSTALLSLAGVALALFPRWPGAVRSVLWTLAALDLLGSIAAAWLLHEWVLAALMAAGAIAWAFGVAGPGRRARLGRAGT